MSSATNMTFWFLSYLHFHYTRLEIPAFSRKPNGHSLCPCDDPFLNLLPVASLSHLHRVGEQLSFSLVCDSVVSVMVLNINGGMFSVFFLF